MKKITFAILWAIIALSVSAQAPDPYEFKQIKGIAATPVKNQDKTGTCWSFSTTSFLESELLRMGKGEHNLSEMFTVRQVYRQKCENYVRRLGAAQFGEGGLAHDKLNAIRQFGIVPESVYPGRKDPAKPYNHTTLEQSLKMLCDTFIAQAKRGELQEDWIVQVEKTLDAEFGPVPVTFDYQNIQFTPTSFRDYLGLNPDAYINITSFTHHPFWTYFVLEVPDNFSNGQYLNLPLNDFMRCLNYSLQKGYSVEWDADVSNPGFSAHNGLAIVPEADWAAKSAEAAAATFQYWEPEKLVTQEQRQQAFDRLETQDDHLMHITGILNETQGGLYYAVKNSWGEISDRKGFVYVSDAYMRLNTISFTIHKNALPTDIQQRMGITPVVEAKHPTGNIAPLAPTNDRPRAAPKEGLNPAVQSKMHNPNLKVAPAERMPLKKTETSKEK